MARPAARMSPLFADVDNLILAQAHQAHLYHNVICNNAISFLFFILILRNSLFHCARIKAACPLPLIWQFQNFPSLESLGWKKRRSQKVWSHYVSSQGIALWSVVHNWKRRVSEIDNHSMQKDYVLFVEQVNPRLRRCGRTSVQN